MTDTSQNGAAVPPVKIAVVDSDEDLEKCYSIRRAVFVAEQNVPEELELDDRDAEATHFLATTVDGEAVATARYYMKEGRAKIGRVAVLKQYRGLGLGREVMKFVINRAFEDGFAEAVLDSQVSAMGFYSQLGFVAEGPVFDDAGIAHRRMRLVVNQDGRNRKATQ